MNEYDYYPHFIVTGGLLRYTGPLPRTLAKAFAITLAKWQAVIVHKPIYDGGKLTCGLCLYYDSCTECPIKKDTGAPSCRLTPYNEWVNSPYESYEIRTLLALKEIAYLESLKNKFSSSP